MDELKISFGFDSSLISLRCMIPMLFAGNRANSFPKKPVDSFQKILDML
jgi:hypothetical protein